MKAVRLHARGGPDELVFEDAPDPMLNAGDALVRVEACGITPAELTWGATYQDLDGASRLPSIPGHEVSGVVESIAGNGGDLHAGDAVYGLIDFHHDGAAAEYTAVPAAELAPKPRTLDHAQSAAVPLSALTAWQALFDHGGLVDGMHVLIHGAAGGVGTFAVQLARWRGAHVTAVASRDNFELLRELGANRLIDYTTGRFEEKARDIDLVLDTLGGETRRRSWATLRRGGRLIALTGPVEAAEAPRRDLRGSFFVVVPDRRELIEIARLIDEGAMRPVIEAVLPLERARDAFERGGRGRHRGKLVLRVAALAAATR